LYKPSCFLQALLFPSKELPKLSSKANHNRVN
jgi:hypothetical protein